jgi:glycerol-3-phosphate dehydrogenase
MATLRESNLRKLDDGLFDVLIIGGGINGAVSAAALSARGCRVALIEQRDFAGFTSQQSSNLAWGGIKYLENLEFGLVYGLCKSRNHLIRSYPSSVREIRFFTTIGKGFRHKPLFIWLGAVLYWLIGGLFTRAPRYLSRAKLAAEEPAIDASGAAGGLEYSDAYLHDNDARFVFGFIRAALDHGCIAANYVESLGAERTDGLWHVRARDVMTQKTFTVRARALVNAAGPFADGHNTLCGVPTEHHHVFSKGIHLIVNRLTQHHRVLTFFADDGRLFFAIPMGMRTCIGTTDTKVESPHTEVTDADRQFVLDNINKRLKLPQPLTKDDIIAERCGVRPLVIKGAHTGKVDWVQLSRKHAVEVDVSRHHVSVFGGKLTDCLNVGQEVCDAITRCDISLPYPDERWYGEPDEEIKARYFHQAKLMELDGYTSAYSVEPLSTRLWRRYGIEAFRMLDAIREDPMQAQVIIQGTEYTRCEIEQAARREMVTKLEDFLRRRSKIALVLSPEEIRDAQGLMTACEILFGDQARARFQEYFEGQARAAP